MGKKKDPRVSFDWQNFNEEEIDVTVVNYDWDAEELARKIIEKLGGNSRQLSFWGSDDLEELRWR